MGPGIRPLSNACRDTFLASGFQLLASNFWLPASGFRLLASGFLLMASGFHLSSCLRSPQLFVPACFQLLASGSWLLASSYKPPPVQLFSRTAAFLPQPGSPHSKKWNPPALRSSMTNALDPSPKYPPGPVLGKHPLRIGSLSCAHRAGVLSAPNSPSNTTQPAPTPKLRKTVKRDASKPK